MEHFQSGERKTDSNAVVDISDVQCQQEFTFPCGHSKIIKQQFKKGLTYCLL